MPRDQPDMPAHWCLTFAVDDADATAEKVGELGGTVVVPPFDAPWVRMTVLTERNGATFVASVQLDAANFRRSVVAEDGWVIPTGRRARPGPAGGRPAELYRAGRAWDRGGPIHRFQRDEGKGT